MAYRFKLNKSLADGVRRVALEQIDMAMAEVAAAARDHRAVHHSRKCMKRLRALLTLVEPALSHRAFAREDRRFRDVGRALSGARDAQVMMETLAKLEAHDPAIAGLRVTHTAKSWLGYQRRVAAQGLDSGTLAYVIDELQAAAQRFEALKIRGEAFAPVALGVQRTYAKAQAQMWAAYRRPSDCGFHDWRKHVQRHWRHMQLLAPAWPGLMDARVQVAAEVSELLGEDHDLAVLRALFVRDGALFGPGSEVRTIIATCEARQNAVRLAAVPRGQRLFAAPPKAFRRELETYWQSARALAGQDVRAMAQAGEMNGQSHGQAWMVLPHAKAALVT